MTTHRVRKIGHIRLEQRLAGGGMGSVYAGFDEKLRRHVAVKAIHIDRVDDVTRARFLREARLLSQLDHPNICRVYEYIEGNASDYLVLELIRGRDLRQAMADRLGFGHKLRIAEQVAEALAAAHDRGVIHRDLKPGNVMLTPEGRVKVLDFGIARSLAPDRTGDGEKQAAEPPAGSASAAPGAPAGPRADGEGPGEDTAGDFATEVGSVVGTAPFMSPEQARGEPLTAASDLYSLGLVLQELYTGLLPYDRSLSRTQLLHRAAAGRTRSLDSGGVRLDGEVTRLIRSLKSLDPAARPPAVAVAGWLRRLQRRPIRRRRQLAAATAAALLVAVGVQSTWDLRRQRDAAVAELSHAERARRESERLNALLVDLYAVDGAAAGGDPLTVREALDAAAERIPRELDQQPRLRGQMTDALGEIYRRLGMYPRAARMLEAALVDRKSVFGVESVEVADSLTRLAGVYNLLDRHPEAELLLGRALEIRARLPKRGDDRSTGAQLEPP